MTPSVLLVPAQPFRRLQRRKDTNAVVVQRYSYDNQRTFASHSTKLLWTFSRDLRTGSPTDVVDSDADGFRSAGSEGTLRPQTPGRQHEQLAAVNPTGHTFHPEWTYTIKPRTGSAAREVSSLLACPTGGGREGCAPCRSPIPVSSVRMSFVSPAVVSRV